MKIFDRKISLIIEKDSKWETVYKLDAQTSIILVRVLQRHLLAAMQNLATVAMDCDADKIMTMQFKEELREIRKFIMGNPALVLDLSRGNICLPHEDFSKATCDFLMLTRPRAVGTGAFKITHINTKSKE